MGVGRWGGWGMWTGRGCRIIGGDGRRRRLGRGGSLRGLNEGNGLDYVGYEEAWRRNYVRALPCFSDRCTCAGFTFVFANYADFGWHLCLDLSIHKNVAGPRGNVIGNTTAELARIIPSDSGWMGH
jgi:hypothetical protein